MIVFGSITTYERDGKYQLYANEVMLDGAGLLYERYETLKKELAEMGMFAKEYKQPIPQYAKKGRYCNGADGSCNTRYHECWRLEEILMYS